jgi:hypothetical protein
MTVSSASRLTSKFRFFLIVAGCLGLISCTQRLILDVKITQKSVSVDLKKSQFFGNAKPVTACVLRAAVYEERTDREIWSIGPSKSECASLRSFVVGVVPLGFAALRTELPLKGRRYHASVVSDAGDGISDTWEQP